MSRNYPVQIIAIPDGVHGGWVRVSLSLLPIRPADAAPFSKSVDIENWPSEIARLARSMKLALAEVDGEKVRNPKYVVTDVSSDLSGSGYSTAANDRWRTIFKTAGKKVDGFAALARYIETREAGPPPASSSGTPTFDFYPSAELGGLLETLRNEVGARALQLRQNKSVGDARSGGSLSSSEWQRLEALAPWSGADPVGKMNRDRTSLRLSRIRALRRGLATSALGTRILTKSKRGVVEGHIDELNNVSVAAARAFQQASHWTRKAQLAAPLVPLSTPDTEDAFTRFAAAWGLASDDCPDAANCPDPPCPSPDADSDKSNAARKLSGILFYPTLAKYFGLIVDVYVDAREISTTGALSLVFNEDAPDAGKLQIWTAFDHSSNYFGPADKAPAKGGDPEYQHGLLNLRQRMAEDTSVFRYAIRQVDTTNGTKALLDRAVSIGETLRSGGALANGGAQLPDQHETGIVLVDRQAPAKAYERLFSGGLTGPVIYFSENLVRGLRIDVAMSDAAGALTVGDQSRWRTLMARGISFGIDPRFLNDAWVTRVSARDDGLINAAAPLMRSIAGTLSVDAPQEVMTWTGESLAVGVRSDDQKCEETWVDPVTDLAIDIDYYLPDEGTPDLRPSPLRYGRGYRLGARAVYANGCGLTFTDARSRYVSDAAGLLLGEEEADLSHPAPPFKYGRLRQIQPPEVLLPWDEPLTVDVSAPPGETIETLVIRSYGPSTPRARRFLVPSRLAADQAEQHGSFDDDFAMNSSRPRGAFRGPYRAELERERGAFPVARSGGWEFPAQSPGTPNQGEASRGMVLVLDSAAAQIDQEYHPDPLCSSFQARIRLFGNTGPISPPLTFWEKGQHPRTARPAVLDVIGAPRNSPPDFDLADQAEEIDRYSDDGTVTVPKLTVRLAPADEILLDISPLGNPAAMLAQLRGLASALPAGMGMPPTMAITTLMGMGAVAPWTAARTLRIVHAVERPLDPPSSVKIHPVVVTVVPETATTGQKWSSYLGGQSDPMNLVSQESGATTFFVGDASFHRRSTGRLRCEGSWIEHGPAGLRKDADGWTYNPPRNSARLFGIDHIDADGEDQIDFAWDGSKVRALNYAFPDGRARRLELNVIATSRFTNYYGPDSERRHDIASTTVRALVPATFRPPLPSIDRILPMLRWRNRTNSRRTVYTFSRISALRIFLKPDIYASGLGEMLGLLFWTGNKPGEGLCEFEARTGKQGQNVTQWGHDPIEDPLTGAAVLSSLPAPADFNGWDQSADSILPAPDEKAEEVAGKADYSPLPVRVLGFTPVIDPGDGPYCDIEIDAGQTYEPFVRLGLARYQPNACKEELQLSHPVTRTAQVLPLREGSITIEQERLVRYIIRGPGYANRNLRTGQVPDPRQSSTMSIRLMRTVPRFDEDPESRFPPSWLPVLDEQGKPVEIVDQQPAVVGGLAVWTGTLRLPHARWTQRYGVVLEETEWLDSQDANLAEPCGTSSCGAQTPPPNPARRSPIFLHVVDLDRDQDTMRANGQDPSRLENGLAVPLGGVGRPKSNTAWT